MYNKCTAKSLDSGAGVRSRHSNRQNGDEHKEQTPKWCKRKSEQGKKEMRKQTNYWSSFSVTLRPLPKTFADFQCGQLHTSQELCSAAFLYLRIRCNEPFTLQLRGRLSRETQTKTFAHYPFMWPVSWGSALYLPFTQISLRYSKDAPTEVESNSRLALPELKFPLPIASVHVDITYPWLCYHE